MTGSAPLTLIRLAATAVLTLFGVLVLASVLPVAVGWRSHVILTGSMAPAIEPGDVVVFEPLHSPPRPGQIVLVHEAGRQPVTHRVEQVLPDGRLVTKGDANRTADSTPVPVTRVAGRARLVLPYIGRLRLLTTPSWRAGVALLLVLAGAAAVLALTPGQVRRTPGALPADVD